MSEKFADHRRKMERITVFENRDGIKSVITKLTDQSNQRVVMQQGLFMLPYTLKKEEHTEIISRCTSSILIHKDLRTELLNYLDTMGYNTFRLMPDLPNICEAVKRKVLVEMETGKIDPKRVLYGDTITFTRNEQLI